MNGISIASPKAAKDNTGTDTISAKELCFLLAKFVAKSTLVRMTVAVLANLGNTTQLELILLMLHYIRQILALSKFQEKNFVHIGQVCRKNCPQM
jgi:hypothetical protein